MNKKNSKKAAVIIIGNEILSGRTQDLNISYIGKNLEKLGIILVEVIIIPDVEVTIIDKVKHYSGNYDYVFTTGGIGPTHDDITAASIAKAFNVKMLRNSEAVAIMERYYEPGTLTEARLKMADIPEGASLIDNPVSGAPAFQINNVFVLAGVPKIMQAMFDSLTDRLVGGPPILTASVCTNLTESKLAEGMTNIQNECEAVSIGSYPYFKHGKLGVNIVLRSTNKELLLQQTELIEKLIKGIGGKIYKD
ncbi:MAG: competence/damage-inducible protein A [Proteobacteria bacterium]|nr:competence/damage-inducible protein A [Pseudomonadota bacterium]NOG61410.1 competence/damage-inducible protein A [Pseudomonadota bacterium]